MKVIFRKVPYLKSNLKRKIRKGKVWKYKPNPTLLEDTLMMEEVVKMMCGYMEAHYQLQD